MKPVLWRQPPQGVVRCGITAPEFWLCGAKFLLWARAITLALSFNVGKHTRTLWRILKVSCWPLVDPGQHREPTQIRDRCKWSRKLLEDLHITASRGCTANIGKISFYSIGTHTESGICQWLRLGCGEVIMVRKGFGSKKLSVGSSIAGFWYADTREVKSY